MLLVCELFETLMAFPKKMCVKLNKYLNNYVIICNRHSWQGGK